ncbi:MAG: hypothetical protein UW70_C0037G0020 [Candidatus Peregrinibacteria bacterium GW2011_GWA2_44_7]|nr:MAG: hypothetical protein UW70_C0037G0020 [Candidatus Peregrinibacteria bacterium GW2011_GWA2_44_7]
MANLQGVWVRGMRSVAYLQGTEATNNEEDGLLGGLPVGKRFIFPISSSILLYPPQAGLHRLSLN